MEKKRRSLNMLLPTIIMAILAIIFLAVGYSRGEGEHVQGLRSGFKMIVEILPLLLFAFIVAGMVQVLLPQELLSKWIGEESGLKGIFIGTLAGGITPGGPYVSLPLVAGLLKAGAGVGTLVAFLTAWSLWAVARLPMEIGILGWKFTFVRLACTFFFPPIAGFLAQFFFSGFR
jgi:uncharacterized membrane protein YraQ (UPF0718 family)